MPRHALAALCLGLVAGPPGAANDLTAKFAHGPLFGQEASILLSGTVPGGSNFISLLVKKAGEESIYQSGAVQARADGSWRAELRAPLREWPVGKFVVAVRDPFHKDVRLAKTLTFVVVGPDATFPAPRKKEPPVAKPEVPPLTATLAPHGKRYMAGGQFSVRAFVKPVNPADELPFCSVAMREDRPGRADVVVGAAWVDVLAPGKGGFDTNAQVWSSVRPGNYFYEFVHEGRVYDKTPMTTVSSGR